MTGDYDTRAIILNIIFLSPNQNGCQTVGGILKAQGLKKRALKQVIHIYFLLHKLKSDNLGHNCNLNSTSKHFFLSHTLCINCIRSILEMISE